MLRRAHDGFAAGNLLNQGLITQRGPTQVRMDLGVAVTNAASGTYNLTAHRASIGTRNHKTVLHDGIGCF